MATSKALEQKIRKQREAAYLELPKARLCADVVLAVLKSESEFEVAVFTIQSKLGANWSHVTAIQFMSGRQAKFAAECGQHSERDLLLGAHRLADCFCNHVSQGNLSFAELQSLAKAVPFASDNVLD